VGNDLLRGVYDADRAAALSGVPVSTVYYWARKGIWEPALSEEKPKLWTYSDLIALRMIYWLRQDKPSRSPRLQCRRSPFLRFSYSWVFCG